VLSQEPAGCCHVTSRDLRRAGLTRCKENKTIVPRWQTASCGQENARTVRFNL